MNRLSVIRFACLALGLGALLLFSTSCGDGVQKVGGVRSELVASAADTVTALAFAPDGRLFITEQNTGDVRIIASDGQFLPEPFAHVDLAKGLEWGLLGIAIDPEFEENHYVYIYFTRPDGPQPNLARPILMRFTEANNKGLDPTVLIEFPRANPEIAVHVGGAIHFGPDGYLYISIGNIAIDELSQDLSSPFGKILRVTREGDAAPDNPFLDQPDADPRVYAYGLRNTFAFTFEPQSGRLYAADNASANCDELNIIEAGGNYGWPQSDSLGDIPCQNPDAIEPIYHYAQPGKSPEEIGSNVGPTAVWFVSGQVYPSLGDGLLVCEFVTTFMRRLQLAEPNRDQVTDDSVVVEDCAVAGTADSMGFAYYSNGIQIHRLVPQEPPPILRQQPHGKQQRVSRALS